MRYIMRRSSTLSRKESMMATVVIAISFLVFLYGHIKSVNAQELKYCEISSLQPYITDLMIHNEPNSTSDYFEATAQWNEPSNICEVDYRVNVFSGPELCNVTMPNISKNVRTQISSMCDVCFIQVLVLNNQSEVVSQGPCHKVNITSFRLKSMTYNRENNSDVNVTVTFQRCPFVNIDMRPVFDVDGERITTREAFAKEILLQNEYGEYVFSFFNVTRNTTILEFCSINPSLIDTCKTCENSDRIDILLSRSVVIINATEPEEGMDSMLTTKTVISGENSTSTVNIEYEKPGVVRVGLIAGLSVSIVLLFVGVCCLIIILIHCTCVHRKGKCAGGCKQTSDHHAATSTVPQSDNGQCVSSSHTGDLDSISTEEKLAYSPHNIGIQHSQEQTCVQGDNEFCSTV